MLSSDEDEKIFCGSNSNIVLGNTILGGSNSNIVLGNEILGGNSTKSCPEITSRQEIEKKATNIIDLIDKLNDDNKPSAILEDKKPPAIIPVMQPWYVSLVLLPFMLLHILNLLSHYYFNFQ